MAHSAQDPNIYAIQIGDTRTVSDRTDRVVRHHTYLIHDNGARPFRVHVGGGVVVIHADGDDHRDRLEVVVAEVFVGTSPRTPQTEFSGGYGPEFDGNTILYRERDAVNEYCHVGRDIVRFRTHARVVSFVSPVGNNDVPYPYAVDARGNTYLIIDKVVLLAGSPWRLANPGDPYSYYYAAHYITPFRPGGTSDPDAPPVFRGIESWRVGDETFALPYQPWPEADYDRVIPRDGAEMAVRRGGVWMGLSRAAYAELHRAFGDSRGFEPLAVEEVTA